MVRLYIITDKQRRSVENYLRDRPNLMPPKVRAMRLRARSIDFSLIRSDVDLIERLADLDVKIGRKRGKADLFARVQVRHTGASDLKAVMTLRRSKYDEIINAFLEGDEDLVEVDVRTPRHDASYLRIAIYERLKKRGITDVAVSVRGSTLYLERIKK